MSTFPIRRFALYSTLMFATTGFASVADISFEGNSLRVIGLTPDRNTGLDNIFVVYDTQGVRAVYHTDHPEAVKVYSYSNLGGGFAEELTQIETASEGVIIPSLVGNIGYIFEEDDKRYYCWIVNYKPYEFAISSVVPSSESNCDYSVLNVTASASPIHYYTINGQQRTLNREIEIEYDTQEWDSEINSYYRTTKTKYAESIEGEVIINPPAYCATYFTVSGDRFMKEWNWIQSKESEVVQPTAVSVQATAEQTGRDTTNDESYKSNEIKTESTGLGGSAPAQILFKAETTEGVVHNEWQMSGDPDFNSVEYRFNEQELDYTFNEEGTFYLRFIGSNADGSCESMSETFTVNIGSSDLKCPNAFTPDGDGVNDEWKVSYRSIIDFDCWIFDRYGHEIFHFDNPEQGWDGKRGNKTVGPGVYYYVIKATGADGKEYKKSGDINIIRHNINTNINGGGTTN
ncbi:MAG: gliding motility-associated C-terminal domain-containing protein [Muribaculum sp.]|nr:gliding motility-associated C-terminal domain-containing protein [Muribaculum sp.]